MFSKVQFLLFFLLSFSILSFAQDEAEAMRVIHCTALNKNTAVQNIYVDADNTKWIANSDGLYEIYSADNAGKQDTNGDWALLRQRGGNYPFQISLDNSALKKMKALQTFNTEEGENKINATFYDAQKKQLWVGTTDSGLYCYKTSKGDFRLLKHFDKDNSKLETNTINDIYTDRYGRTWVATDAGVLMGTEKKWKLYEKETKVFSIVNDKTNVWIMNTKYLWKIDEANRWMLDDLDERLYRGPIREIAYDSQGRLWVASDIITRFDVLNDKVEVYDASNGFTSNSINCIKVDKDDALWVGTDEGLFLIEAEATMTISCLVEKELSCAGSTDDATLLVKVFGGTPPYKYTWDNGFSGPNPQNVGPGKFTVTVKDAEGITKSAAAKIVDNRMQAELVQQVDAIDGKNNGKAEVKVAGGVPPYSYKWDSGETKAKAKRLSPGVQFVEISDNAGCVINFSVAIGGVVIADTNTKDTDGLSIDFSISAPPSCANEKNSAIDINVEGGTPPYSYKWNQADLTGSQITGIGAGEYNVTVSDASGKTKTQSIYLEAPDPIIVTAVMDQAVTGDRKRDGIIYANAKGGTGKFSYEWSNSVQKAKVYNVAKGKYTVTVTDDSGCSGIGTVEVTKQINMALASSGKVKTGQIIRLEKLFFEADSTQITDISLPTLNEMVKFMEKNPTITIEVGGHTNSVPPHEYCDKLSSARAKSVAEYLVLRGVNRDRVKYRGYGKRKPIASNNTAAGRRRNQRVEIKIL